MSIRPCGDPPPGHAKAVHMVSGSRSLGRIVQLRRLEGYGILKPLHPVVQVLNLLLLLGQEEVFNPVQP
jgi:hypothetical protein